MSLTTLAPTAALLLEPADAAAADGGDRDERVLAERCAAAPAAPAAGVVDGAKATAEAPVAVPGLPSTGAPRPTPPPPEVVPPAPSGAEGAVQVLVAQAQAGDKAAFAALYGLFAPRVLRYLRGHLGARPGAAALAEDLTADVFLRTLEKLPSYHFRGAPFAAWLYRVAHNRLVDHLRLQPKFPLTPLESCVSLDDPSATRALAGALDQHHLAGALARLTPDQQAVIRHRFLHDRSLADTARLLGKHDDAVKQLQVRALRSMRRTLNEM